MSAPDFTTDVRGRSTPCPGSETPVVRVGAGRRHMSQSIRSALWNQALDHFTHEDGRPMTKREAFNELIERLKAGEERIPVGECDHFDPKLGCLGHPAESQNADERGRGPEQNSMNTNNDQTTEDRPLLDPLGRCREQAPGAEPAAAGAGEVWICSPRLRWKSRYVPVPDGTRGAVGMMGSYLNMRFLQQAWQSTTTGAVEWRDVPDAESEGEGETP